MIAELLQKQIAASFYRYGDVSFSKAWELATLAAEAVLEIDYANIRHQCVDMGAFRLECEARNMQKLQQIEEAA